VTLQTLTGSIPGGSLGTQLLTGDAPSVGAAYGAPLWGIFSASGKQILVSDSVKGFGYQRDYNISDYPQEQGAFASYNKVQVPYQARVDFLIGASRRDFLNSVEAAVQSLALVTVTTPEIPYMSANLKSYRYQRDARSGFSLILVTVMCEEIRIPSGGTSQTSSTNAASPTQSGQIQGTQTTQPNPATTATVGGDYVPLSSSLAVQPVSADGYTSLPSTPSADLGNAGSTSVPFSGVTGGVSNTIPAGVPNSTGGGTSTLNTPVSDYT
jgi:hypothetical protein